MSSIWAAVRGAAGSYLQQDEARKAEEAEAERIRKKEEMAAKLREEDFAREDAKDQEAAEREQARYEQQQETARLAREDAERRRTEDVDYRDKGLKIRQAGLAATSKLRDEQKIANDNVALERAERQAERDQERAIKEANTVIQDEIKKEKKQAERMSYEERIAFDQQIFREAAGDLTPELVRNITRQALIERAEAIKTAAAAKAAGQDLLPEDGVSRR
jgi:hypothetical protein